MDSYSFAGKQVYYSEYGAGAEIVQSDGTVVADFKSHLDAEAFLNLLADDSVVKPDAMPFQLPLRVEYHRRCPEWHEKSSPYIVDAAGKLVVMMPQNVGHPGQYDEMADLGARMIVDSVNTGRSVVAPR